MMTAPSSRPDLRGRSTAAAVEALFAALWFAATAPPSADSADGLRAATVLSVLTAGAGAMLAWQHRHRRTALHAPAVRRRFRRIAIAEFGALAVGAVILGLADQGRWVPVWACAVIGAHFLPLAKVVGGPPMRVLGMLLIGAATVAAGVGATTAVAPALVAGPAAGTCLLLTAALTLTGLGSQPPAARASATHRGHSRLTGVPR